MLLAIVMHIYIYFVYDISHREPFLPNCIALLVFTDESGDIKSRATIETEAILG